MPGSRRLSGGFGPARASSRASSALASGLRIGPFERRTARNCSSGRYRDNVSTLEDLMKKPQAPAVALSVAVSMLITAVAVGQHANPRIGKWKLKQEPPAINIMTYEPAGDRGMKVTVESKN